MPLSHSMMQGGPPIAVGRVQRALVLDQQVHHGHGAHGGGAVEGVLASFVADAGGCRGVLVGVGEELTGYVEIVFGGYEVDHGLTRLRKGGRKVVGVSRWSSWSEVGLGW